MINLVFKSGGNQLHGSLYEFLRNSALEANNWFSNRAGQPKAHNSLNQFGGTAGGPLVLPRVYDGHNRTFWFVNYEGLRDRRALSRTFTIPTPEQLRGDFSQTRNAAGQPLTIFDPLTTRPDPTRPGNFLRDPFPGNRIPPERMDPVAMKVRTLWPVPTSAGTGPAGVNNWTGAGWVNPGGSGMPIDINARNLSVDHTWTISPALLLNLRYGFMRQWVARDPPLLGLDLTTLGFTPEYNAQVGVRALPAFMPAGYRAVHQRGTDYIRRGDLTHAWQGSLTKVTTRQTIKTGADYRLILLNELEPIISQGQFFFDGRFTGGDPLRATANSGHSIASFLLGLPSSGNIDIVPPLSVSYGYLGGYLQDDLKVNARLTLNLGLRYEVETARNERYNRLSWFDSAVRNPLGERVGIGGLRGGLQFAGAEGRPRRQKDTNYNGWGPRFGFAWSINSNTVIRGGYALFLLPNTGDGAGPANAAEGFVASTAFVSSLDGGVTPADRLRNPFPGGVVRGPGGSLGLLTQLGQDLTTVRRNDPSSYSQEWSLNVQRQWREFFFDVAYASNKGTSLPVNMQFNQIADEFLSLGPNLLAQVPNPFAPFVTVGPLSRDTVARGQLLRPFPQFGSVLHRNVRDISSIYHSLQMKVEHRFSQGYSFLGAYTFSKLMAGPVANAVVSDPGFQNNNNRRGDRSLAGFDQPQRLVLSAMGELPFGREKRWLAGVRGLGGKLVSGWQVNTIATFQSGFPIGLSTAVNQTNSFGGGSRPNNSGKSAKLTGSIVQRLDRYFDTSVFSQPAPFTFGNTSRTLPDVRTPGIMNFDFSVTKITGITERVSTQFRAEFFNGFNHPNFGGPGTSLGVANFGVISSALDPRIIQFGLKVIY